MSEPTTEPSPIDHATIAAQLQNVVTELRQKNDKRKSRIAELESTATDLQNKLSAATEQLKQVTVEMPLRSMSEQMSTAPDLWLQEFQKSMTITLTDGKLMVHDIEGKPVITADGKQLAFERDALTKHLTNEEHPLAQTFRAITIVSRASGAASTGGQRQTRSAESAKAHRFGLR